MYFATMYGLDIRFESLHIIMFDEINSSEHV